MRDAHRCFDGGDGMLQGRAAPCGLDQTAALRLRQRGQTVSVPGPGLGVERAHRHAQPRLHERCHIADVFLDSVDRARVHRRHHPARFDERPGQRPQRFALPGRERADGTAAVGQIRAQ